MTLEEQPSKKPKVEAESAQLQLDNTASGLEDNLEELQYLDLLKKIIDSGEKRADRTKTGTVSLFAPPQLRFDLGNSQFPLLTTKKVFYRAIVEELLFFIRGQTDGTILENKGVKIWAGNGSREYLDSIGLTERKQNDLGPIYGFQWRHFGAEYIDYNTDYTGKGYDQLQHVIDTIKTNPTDRRMILSAWNPADLKKMALPPCHMFAQFYVERANTPGARLSCQFYQRSCDMGLGVPFNIASYALLTIMIAHVTGLEPGHLVYCMGDAHVYLDHIDALKTQLERKPVPFPKLKIEQKVRKIEDFQLEDFDLIGYNPHTKIQMKMSV